MLRNVIRRPPRVAPPRRRFRVRNGLNYKKAGVDISAGNELVRRIKRLNPSIGGFNGMVPFGDHFLVAGTDGVGTKLKLAFEMGKHDTVGIDLVAMSVNDVLTSGAHPMFFLDYYATGKLDVDVAEQTAEMPGFYGHGEYDVAGFAVGSVHKHDLVDGKANIRKGDALIGLKSSGIHSNGFSLVRKVLEVTGMQLTDPAPWDGNQMMGSVLLEPTVIYVPHIRQLNEKVKIKGMVHVTGGGFPENLPRMMPDGLTCFIDTSSWHIPPIFQWIQKNGQIDDSEMFRTFNMGIGMVLAIDKDQAQLAIDAREDALIIGNVIEGEDIHYQ